MKIVRTPQSAYFVGILSYKGRISYLQECHADTPDQALAEYIRYRKENDLVCVDKGDIVHVVAAGERVAYSVLEADEPEEAAEEAEAELQDAANNA